MTDYRALCARMADELDHYRQLLMDDRRETHALAAEARAALAQPEPVAPRPTDDELCELYRAAYYACENRQGPAAQTFALRAVLVRWGTPANNTREEI
jgi:hypothetical protein